MTRERRKRKKKRNAYAKLTHIKNANTNNGHGMAAQKMVQKHTERERITSDKLSESPENGRFNFVPSLIFVCTAKLKLLIGPIPSESQWKLKQVPTSTFSPFDSFIVFFFAFSLLFLLCWPLNGATSNWDDIEWNDCQSNEHLSEISKKILLAQFQNANCFKYWNSIIAIIMMTNQWQWLSAKLHITFKRNAWDGEVFREGVKW